jgi:polysaccharide pyruvyl transferase WcaK-like protein
MIKKVRIGHLASFQGNLGDIANHRGFRSWFEQTLNSPVDWVNIEIRDFYRGLRNFDDNFVKEINEYEIFIIGGGNYFELWPTNSRTGCSIDLPSDLLEKIRTPIFFNALGLDDGQGLSQNALRYFPEFILTILNNSRNLLSLRNDGSHSALTLNFKELQTIQIPILPDHGFFALENSGISRVNDPDNLVLGVNLAQDMPEIRFPEGKKVFLQALSLILKEVKFERVIFFPHVFSDLGIIADLLEIIPDPIRRNKTSVAAFGSTEGEVRNILDLYSRIDIMLGMRFHANVLPISLGVPTIGLATYPQILKLFKEIEIENWVINCHDEGWEKRAIEKFQEFETHRTKVELEFSKVQLRIRRHRTDFEPTLAAWLKSVLH